jgi:hypothetical protein
MSVARTFKERDDVITDFIQVIAEAVGCRPMLAMSLLPFQLDPWSSEKGKAPKVEEVTFDMLVRTLRGLLCAYWSEDHSDPQYLTRLTELVAKQTVLGMLSAAANKRDEDDIVEATTYMLM